MTKGLPRRLATLRASDIMSRNVITLQTDDSMAGAAQKLREANVTGAPVVNAEGRLVGILSATDMLTYEQQEAGARAPRPGSAAEEAVEEYMSPRVDTIADDALLVCIARKMCDGHHHRLVVVDREERVAGIVSTMDVLATLVNFVDEAEAMGE